MSHFRVGQKNPQSPLQQSFADIKKTYAIDCLNEQFILRRFFQGAPELQHILCDSLNFLSLFQFSVDALNI